MEISAEAKRSIAELTPRIARLLISCTMPDAEISVDGKQVGQSPLVDMVRVSPGSHQVTATHPRGTPAIEIVKVAAGTVERVMVRFAYPLINQPSRPRLPHRHSHALCQNQCRWSILEVLRAWPRIQLLQMRVGGSPQVDLGSRRLGRCLCRRCDDRWPIYAVEVRCLEKIMWE